MWLDLHLTHEHVVWLDVYWNHHMFHVPDKQQDDESVDTLVFPAHPNSHVLHAQI